MQRLEAVYKKTDNVRSGQPGALRPGERILLVRELMKREVVTVGPDALLVLAARTMRDQDIGACP
jgi:CBS domain-containing protein